MHLFTKQTNEKYPITVDFSGVLNTLETISNVSVVGYDSSNSIVTSTIIDSSSIATSNTVSAIVKAGTNKERYKITFVITTNSGCVYEEDVFMKISNV